ncbi:hypothetical protein GCM10027589_34040 [Actinocorallia lasiicapitis]
MNISNNRNGYAPSQAVREKLVLMSESDEQIVEAQLIAEFGDEWKFKRGRRSDGEPGDLMCTRRRPLSRAEEDAGLCVTLPMGYTQSVADLERQLRQQIQRAKVLDERIA